MSNHLAECLLPDFDKGVWVCCCAQLRACEQRVLRDAVNSDAVRAAIRMAYTDGLSAARDAVAALPEYAMRDRCLGALDSIDALRNARVLNTLNITEISINTERGES